MKGLARIVGIAGVCALLLLGGALLFLNSILHYALERGGSVALGTATRVDSVRVQPLAGRLDVRGLQIDNPPGFDEPPFLSLGEGWIELDLASLRKERIVFPRIEIHAASVHLQRVDGRTNYAAILDNLAGGAGDAVPAEQEEPSGGGFVIEELRITNVKAHVALIPRTGGLTEMDLEVPEIRLANVGSDSGESIFGQLSAIVVQAVLNAVVTRSAGLPLALTRDLTARLDAIPGMGALTGAVGRTPRAAVETAEQLLEDAASTLLRGLRREPKPDPE